MGLGHRQGLECAGPVNSREYECTLKFGAQLTDRRQGKDMVSQLRVSERSSGMLNNTG